MRLWSRSRLYIRSYFGRAGIFGQGIATRSSDFFPRPGRRGRVLAAHLVHMKCPLLLSHFGLVISIRDANTLYRTTSEHTSFKRDL